MPPPSKPHNALAAHKFRCDFDEVKVPGTISVFPGTGGEGADTDFYMPDDVFNVYFSDDRVQQIIAQLYKASRSGFLLVQPSVVHRNYKRILAILLFIERGDMIEHFVHMPELCDQKLPFHSRPTSFPDNSGDPFFGDFQKVQWKFCAPQIYDWERVDWHSDCILPFVRVGQPLGRGHSGKAYRIEIHPAHDRLNPDHAGTRVGMPLTGKARQQDVREAKREPHLAKAYVLKTFHPRRGSEAQWSHEVEAHVALRSTLRQDPGIIWFHHCYTHGKTCNVILELAPFGDLEDLLQKLDPPKTREDIMLFWRSFLRLLETLAYLRDMTYQDQSAYQLCHFDLKPQNILVCPGKSSSRYDLQFKIGDFGSSNFCVLRNDSQTYAEYYPGTRTFGAPECYNWNPFSDSTRTSIQKVLPDADMWSLGAIAFEIAEWMRSGPPGITVCRQWRRTAHQHNPRFKVADCFHDGKDVLECVETHMDILIRHCNPEDATGAVVRLIRKHMLVANPESRMPARHLQIEADNALNGVQNHWASVSKPSSIFSNPPVRRSTGSSLMIRTSTSGSFGQGHPSPNSSSHVRKQSNGWPTKEPAPSHIDSTNGAVTMSRPRPSPYSPRDADSGAITTLVRPDQTVPNHQRAYRPTSSVQLGSNNPFLRAQMPVKMPVIHQDPIVAADSITHQKTRGCNSDPHLSDINNLNSRKTYASQHSDRLPPHANRTSSAPPVQNALGLDSTDRRPADPVWSDVGQSITTYHANQWSPTYNRTPPEPIQPVPFDPKQSASQVSNYTEDMSEDAARTPSSTTADSATKSKSKRLSEVEVLGLDEAQERLQSAQKPRSKLKRFSRGSKPEFGKLEQYEDRDFIILVDDSTSMHTHWPKVVDCVKLLADYTTPYDDNGIEVRLMKNYRSKKVTKDPDLVKTLIIDSRPRRNGDVVIAQITSAFQFILGEYRKKLEAKASIVDKVFGKREKKLIVFVLTDGETCVHYDAKGPILDLVTTLRAQKRDIDHVGIQFVQFGDNERASAKLAELDGFLDPSVNASLVQDADNKDIVDVERWDGVNVWKLLLGSIDKRFDHADSPVPSTPIQRTLSPLVDLSLQSPTFGGGPVGLPSGIPMSREGSKEGEQRRPQPFPPYYSQHAQQYDRG